MDAVKFIKELGRMCDAHEHCESCPAKECECQLLENMVENTRIVSIVEKWSAAHPRKTRQSEFLKLFPDANLSTGTVNVCPNSLYEGKCDCTRYQNCLSCKREFWMQEA